MRDVTDTSIFQKDRKGRIVSCPNCGGPVVFDSGLWHCDGPSGKAGQDGCGAWDSAFVVRTEVVSA